MMPHDPHVKAVLCSIFIFSTSMFVSDSISWHLPPWWWGESVLVLKHANTTTSSASTFATSSANSGGKNLQHQLDSLLLCPIGVRWPDSGRMTLGLGTKNLEEKLFLLGGMTLSFPTNTCKSTQRLWAHPSPCQQTVWE